MYTKIARTLLWRIKYFYGSLLLAADVKVPSTDIVSSWFRLHSVWIQNYRTEKCLFVLLFDDDKKVYHAISVQLYIILTSAWDELQLRWFIKQLMAD